MEVYILNLALVMNLKYTEVIFVFCVLLIVFVGEVFPNPLFSVYKIYLSRLVPYERTVGEDTRFLHYF